MTTVTERELGYVYVDELNRLQTIEIAARRYIVDHLEGTAKDHPDDDGCCSALEEALRLP